MVETCGDDLDDLQTWQGGQPGKALRMAHHRDDEADAGVGWLGGQIPVAHRQPTHRTHRMKPVHPGRIGDGDEPHGPTLPGRAGPAAL